MWRAPQDLTLFKYRKLKGMGFSLATRGQQVKLSFFNGRHINAMPVT